MDAGKNITQDTIKVFKNQIIQRRSKYSCTINCGRATSNILINGPYIDSFLSNENSHRYTRTEQDANSINKQSPQKDSFQYSYKYPASTINNTDSISAKQFTPEGKEMDNPNKGTEANNYLLDPKKKEMQVNKNQSQSKENKLHTG